MDLYTSPTNSFKEEFINAGDHSNNILDANDSRKIASNMSYTNNDNSCCNECTNLSLQLLGHQIEVHRTSIFSERHSKIMNILRKIQNHSDDYYEILTSIVKVSQNSTETYQKPSNTETVQMHSRIKTEIQDIDAIINYPNVNQTVLPPYVDNFDKIILDDKKSIDYFTDIFTENNDNYTDNDQKNDNIDNDNDDSGAGSYECSLCDQGFSNSIALHKHNKKMHRKKSLSNFNCLLCDKKFTNQKSINMHTLKMHKGDAKENKVLDGMKSYSDNEQNCDDKNMTKKRLKKHRRTKSQYVSPKNAERIDLDTTDDKELTKCDDCGKYFPERSMYYHKKTYHGVAYRKAKNKKLVLADNPKDVDTISNDNFISYSCDICNKTVKSKQTLVQHLRSKHGALAKNVNAIGPTYKCDECGQMFTGLMKYRSHMRLIHPDKPWMPQRQRDTPDEVNLCELCGSEFSTRGQLKSHMVRHINQRPYKCTICEKDFLQKVHLKDHMNTHSGEKPYKCVYDGCTREFAHASGRVAHHKIVHEILKKYKCEFCPREYSLKTRLRCA